MVDIVFLTPGPNVEMIYLKSMLKTIKVLEEKGIIWDFYGEFSSHVAFARQITLDTAEDIECKVFFWIDSDIVWEPEDVLKLYGSSKEVVSGAYPMDNGNVTAKTDEGWLEHHQLRASDELIKLDFCGLGFFAIKSHVLRGIPEPQFSTTLLNDLEGEDVALCRKVKAAGFDIWLDPTVKLGHVKKSTLRI
jgi:hypothetical protein